jgi:hypothetical protein
MIRALLPLTAAFGLAAAPNALARPAGPIAYDMTVAIDTSVDWKTERKPYDRDCSHHAAWSKASGSEAFAVKTPQAVRVEVEPTLGTLTFPRSGRSSVHGALVRGRWSRDTRTSSGSSPGPCGGTGEQTSDRPADCGLRLPEQVVWLGFHGRKVSLWNGWPDNLPTDAWGSCRFYVYPEDFPRAPGVSDLTAPSKLAQLKRGARTVRMGRTQSVPARVLPDGTTVSGRATWTVVFTRAGR